MSLTFSLAKRLKKLPPYLFLEIDRAKRAAKAQGRDIIDLGVGDPDLPTPPHIIEALCRAAHDPANHRYAFDSGLPLFRQTIADWFLKRFQVSLDPQAEIYPLIGSKEGLAHLPLGIVDPNDTVVVPEPAYPAYRASIAFAGGRAIYLKTDAKNHFIPDLSDLKKIKKVKVMYVNYPNNPTAATAPKEFYRELIAIAQKRKIIVISDLAYSEMYYDGQKPLSLLEIPGAKDVAIEFHSLSKTYNMTGWRIGWACGNPQLIAALGKIKSNYDSGIFQAIQVAGIAALKSKESLIAELRAIYQERRDIFIAGLNRLGWQISPPKATFYIFAPIPKGFKNAMTTAKTFLDQADIVATPGVGFGKSGEGYIRMTLTVNKKRLLEAVERLKKIL